MHHRHVGEPALPSAHERDVLAVPRGPGAQGDEERAALVRHGHARLEVELVPLVAAAVVELASPSLAGREGDGASDRAVGRDEGDEVGVVLHERQAAGNEGEARRGAHARRAVERGVLAVGVVERRARHYHGAERGVEAGGAGRGHRWSASPGRGGTGGKVRESGAAALAVRSGCAGRRRDARPRQPLGEPNDPRRPHRGVWW